VGDRGPLCPPGRAVRRGRDTVAQGGQQTTPTKSGAIREGER
jgi:hypothetical protein